MQNRDMGMQDRAVPLSKMRRIIGERMCVSLARTAQYTLTREMEIDALLEYVRQQRENGKPLKFMHVLTKAVASLLKEHERLNASIAKDAMIYHDTVNMGIAVALPDGILVPVLKNVDASPLTEIAEAYDALIPKAKAGRLAYEDMSEGTFTISNLGVAGIDAFTPIIHYPESAILGVGRTIDRVVLNDDDVPRRRKTAVFSLTVDHRVIDGYVGARFLSSLADTLSDADKLRGMVE